MYEILQELKEEYICPITQQQIQNPVITVEGHTYERDAIIKWFQNSTKSSTTNLPLISKHLVPNYSFKSLQQKVFKILPQIIQNQNGQTQENQTFRKQFTNEINTFEKQKYDLQKDIFNLELQLIEQTKKYAKLHYKLMSEKEQIKQENILLVNNYLELQKNSKYLLGELGKQFDDAKNEIREKEERIKFLENALSSEQEHFHIQINNLQKIIRTMKYEMNEVNQSIYKFHQNICTLWRSFQSKQKQKKMRNSSLLMRKNQNLKEDNIILSNLGEIEVKESESSIQNQKINNQEICCNKSENLKQILSNFVNSL